MDCLNDNEYIEKLESEFNDYVNSYVICDDYDFK